MMFGFVVNYLIGMMVCFFIGCFIGIWFISCFVLYKVLVVYVLFVMFLCLIFVFSGGYIGLLVLMLCSVFMLIQYLIIFLLGIKNLGQDIKYGLFFIVMIIIGGGIVMLVMGFVSDVVGKILIVELVLVLCFVVIFIFVCFCL